MRWEASMSGAIKLSFKIVWPVMVLLLTQTFLFGRWTSQVDEQIDSLRIQIESKSNSLAQRIDRLENLKMRGI